MTSGVRARRGGRLPPPSLAFGQQTPLEDENVANRFSVRARRVGPRRGNQGQVAGGSGPAEARRGSEGPAQTEEDDRCRLQGGSPGGPGGAGPARPGVLPPVRQAERGPLLVARREAPPARTGAGPRLQPP